VSDRGPVRECDRCGNRGLSHSDFGFVVVQRLDDATGEELLCAEIVEDQLAVLTPSAGVAQSTGRDGRSAVLPYRSEVLMRNI
jgi:hypothetical protein